MSITQRCGTGDTGCSTQPPAIQYMPTNMCNGVFAPVCAPEICNVPRIPHHEILAEGQGILLDDTTKMDIQFNIFVERVMQVYKGKFEFQDPPNSINLNMSELKFFESDGYTHLVALFHNPTTHQNTTVTLYQDSMLKSTHLFIHSTSIMTQPINLSGLVTSGTLHLYPDHNVHDH